MTDPSLEARGRADWTGRLEPTNQEVAPLLWALLPWLGLPYLLSAELARAGHPLPGEVLPVAAFLPLVALAYLMAAAWTAPRRRLVVGLVGAAALAVLLVRLVAASDHDAGKLTAAVALAATLATVALCALAGRLRPAWLASPVTLALVLAQALDGWLTYLAVGNPFGWLDEPAHEQVRVSRFLLAHAPALFPLLKAGLALAVAFGVRQASRPGLRLALAAAVCYVGVQPALFSAANLM